jgi:CheY-like chemotaxis protein
VQKDAERAEVVLEPLHGGEFFVRGDREPLREGVLALLDNAIRYGRPGAKVWGKLTGAGATVRVEIGDTGPGIPPEKLAALFEPFDPSSTPQLKRREPGSSLSRVRQVAQLHGGALSVQSTPGEGTVFTFTLPLFAGMVEAEPPRVAQAQRGGILLVEDDDDCREGVQVLLETEGIEVTSVSNAEAAIAALATLRPAMVMVDLRLRGGDGRSVIAHVRATPELANLPVYVMSGAVSEASTFRSDGPHRIDGFFEKPLNLPRVLATIRSVIPAEVAE